MNTAAKVYEILEGLKAQGLTKAEIVWRLAEACLGWPYVFGAVGELCTKANRQKYYNNYINTKPAEAEQIKKRCQILGSGKPSCTGCSYYPGDSTRCYDCRGFTRWCLAQVDISLQGAGATSQWNNESNWSLKGKIEDLPPGVLACFFHADGSVMQHTGFIKDGTTIHCSGTVKKETPSKKITHFAVPKGLDEVPCKYPTLRRGSSGEYVKLLQEKLIEQGYDLGSYGADGKFGAKTEAAVRQFQKDWGLEQDGVAGPRTWERLMTAPVREKFYSVTIRHLDKTQAEAMANAYPNCIITEE